MKSEKINPDYLRAHKPELLHTNKVLLRFNRRELAAIDEYVRRFGISRKAPALRRIIMERILSDLGESNPTLF